ncbi:unnamed protein product [Cochlearia groenlandica]
MRFLCCLHVILYLSLFSHLFQKLSATNASSSSSSSLDALLQDYSFRAIVGRPRTGILYEATVPTNLSTIKLSAIRLRSGSLRSRGLSVFKEFEIPKGLIFNPYVKRLILVYQNLANLSHLHYPPLSGYDYVAPVLGLLAYDAMNLSAVNLPKLDLRVTKEPIKIDFSVLEVIPKGSVAKCVSFDSKGVASFSDSVKPGNTCVTNRHGHFSVVVKKKKKKIYGLKFETLIIVGSVLGGLFMLGLVLCFVMRCWSFKKKEKRREMEREGETGEALRMTYVGETRAPTASTTRTQPMLENEYTS